MVRSLLKDIVAVRHLGGHRLWLRFEDGIEGEIDLRDVIGEFTGALAPLADPAFVAGVFVNERRTITWPGELDLDPVVLYCAVRGIPVPTYEAKPAQRPKTGSGGGRRRRSSSHAAKRGRKAGA